MLYPLRALYTPSMFQGANRRDRYFEGWYLKCIDSPGAHPIAIIPGISLDREGDTSHSFVQVIRPGGRVKYVRYPVEAFSASKRSFEVEIGPNRLSSTGVTLDLPRGDGIDELAPDGVGSVKGELRFGPLSEWPVTLFSPGIMGWYRYVPRMECYHGIVSMDHTLDGTLEVGGPGARTELLDFARGRGYAEKDWGTSFPSSWIWAQSNHFTDASGKTRPGVSAMVSVARIPWLDSWFVGSIGGVLLDGELHRFATYTSARVTRVESGDGAATVVLDDGHMRVRFGIDGAQAGALKAPRHGAMTGLAHEALGTTLQVCLERRRGERVETLFDGTGAMAGAEIMNDNGELVPDE